jgi:hypothetical protein
MFRFSIRDLLWLTVVVALGAAWWMDRSRYQISDPWAVDKESVVYLPVALPKH